MRASRLLSILILLQHRARLTADALAQEFGVSERTIYRDIDELGAAGIPVIGDRGPGGGFRLLEGYRTKLTGLTPDEAETMFLVACLRPRTSWGWAKPRRGRAESCSLRFPALPPPSPRAWPRGFWSTPWTGTAPPMR
ncbi:MAG: HTH domain-containing protein [Betaproteobacteria bacterium]|nr:HTH domain-containing protein [Betaproteobacteria bacterium]